MATVPDFVLSVAATVVSGLVLAAVVGIFKILFEFRRWTGHMESFEKIVHEELIENRQSHMAIRKQLNEHMAAEMALVHRMSPGERPSGANVNG